MGRKTKAIKCVQNFALSITGTNTGATATLNPPVDPSNTLLLYLGVAGAADESSNVRLELTNSTTVSAYRSSPSSGISINFRVVEFN